MNRPIGLLLALLGGLALALTYLAGQGTVPDSARHERTLESLRGLLLSEAALQRDVLRARAGLLANYDPLVQSVEELERAAASLRRAGNAGSAEADIDLTGPAERLAAAVRDQAAQVETFKSRNALLQNSLAYFGLLSGQLANAEVDELARAMFRFTGGRQRQAASEVSAALERLAGRAEMAPAGEGTAALVAHSRLILDNHTAVDRLVNGILAAPVAESARALQDRYLDLHGRASERAELFRKLLYAVALVLAGYLGLLLLRLRANARALRSRLALESLIAGISTDFIDLPREKMARGLDKALARLGEHTGVDRANLLLAEKGRVEHLHQWSRVGPEKAGLTPEALLDLATGQSDRSDYVHLPDVPGLSDPAARAPLERAGIGSWLCIPLWRSGGRVGFLTLDSRRPKRWQEDDIALLRTVAEIFANALDRERGEVEREVLQARLAQAQRLEAVGTLAGGIAHEFNNVLGVILGSAEMAMGAASNDDAVRRNLRRIASAGERARSVVDQILAFSRKRERQKRPVRFEPVVAEAIELIRTSLPASVELRVRLDAGTATVEGDPTELQQVVMNLCTNAAQAMDARGTIDIGLDRLSLARGRTVSHGSLTAGRYVRLAVSDSGRGMDAETLQRAVEPFFTTKPVGQGTGLGLSTVHGIVAQHGGALNVTSRPGAGSTFEAFWPESEEEAPAEAEGEVAPPCQGRGETVLLVDDDPALVLLGEEMLAALGYEPVGFDRSRAALNAVRAQPQRFDLALLDEVMPELTGSELAAALHELRPDLPIVLTTGHPGGLPAQRLEGTGICAVLGKPLRSAPLAACLAQQLSAAPRRAGAGHKDGR